MPTGERIKIPDEIRSALSDKDEMPDSLELKGRKYTLDKCVGSGYKAVVWLVMNESGRQRALKLACYDDYMNRSFKSEVQFAAELEDHRQVFAMLEDAGLVKLPIGDQEITCVFFVEDWVPGITLDSFLTDHPDEVTPAFLLQFALDMSQALNALSHANLAHDDLHAKNIMLADPPTASFTSAHQLRVIDLGSLKRKNDVTKLKTDLDHVVDHLIRIHNVIVEGRRADRRGRRLIVEVARIIERMVDRDPAMRLQAPSLIREAFEAADGRSKTVKLMSDRSINSPFEFISSEHIADDATFIGLFAETPWMSKVASRDPCLLTGPRGCGKSTLFRWLSLKTQLAAQKDLDRFNIAGVFVACSTELEGRFSWIKTEELARANERSLVHYFNLMLVHELVATLVAMRAHQATAESDGAALQWNITPHDEESILEFLLAGLNSENVSLGGVSPLQQALDLVARERWKCELDIRTAQTPPFTTTESLLGDLTARLVELIPFFAEHRITFLVDDFTERRLNRHVQRVLNRVVRLRRESVVFKISSEKRGADFSDSAGLPLDASRELVEIDVGREYLSLAEANNVARARQFAINLLDNRLEAAGYAGRASTLLGETNHGKYGSLSKALRDGNSKSAYHGNECIADLCSGDVSTLLLIHRRIFEQARVDKTRTTVIPPSVQHETIRRVSSDQLAKIRTHVPAGREMHQIAEQFGTLVGNILRNGRDIKQSPSRYEPPACPRIEVDGAAETPEHLDTRLLEIYDELVRCAIFIEMEPGLGMHGNVQTLRWQLRRIFLPASQAALNKNVAVKMDPSDFKQLLDQPAELCKRFYARWPMRDGIDQEAIAEM